MTAEERKIISKKYYEANKEKIAKSNKKYREKNKEKIAKSNKKYYETNKEKILNSDKKYYEANKEKVKEITKKYREENTEKVKEITKKYYEANKEKITKYNKKYRKENKEKINISYNNKIKNDNLFRLKENTSSLIFQSLKLKGYQKKSRTHEILGCSYEDFKIHLEKQFESWMNWENKGNPKDGKFEPNKTWDIDHIIPLASAKTEEEVMILNHYTNLRPLCSYYNRVVKKHYLEEDLKKDLVDNL